MYRMTLFHSSRYLKTFTEIFGLMFRCYAEICFLTAPSFLTGYYSAPMTPSQVLPASPLESFLAAQRPRFTMKLSAIHITVFFS